MRIRTLNRLQSLRHEPNLAVSTTAFLLSIGAFGMEGPNMTVPFGVMLAGLALGAWQFCLWLHR
jgi:hypothetical protein